jgi:DtxR family Mn-dependent transcriptional regulator
MTQSKEDYLEMVSFLADESFGKGEARVTDIAARLGFSKPSVLAALKWLVEQDLITHERYGTVELTHKGRQKAAEIRERHDFLTGFLSRIIGVDADTAEKDACKIEHILSPETLLKLKEFAQNYSPRISQEKPAEEKKL